MSTKKIGVTEQKDMSFLDHLEVLRWHIIRSFGVIAVCAIFFIAFSGFIYDHILFAHLKGDFVTYRWMCNIGNFIGFESDFCSIDFEQNLISLTPTSQFMNMIWVGLIFGFLTAFPYVLYEIWRFISPGLYEEERNKSKVFIFLASLLFFIGVAFSFYVIAPLSVYFFYSFKVSDVIQNQFNYVSHISLVTNTILGVSLMFELPVVIYFLAKLGLITPEILKKYRKYAIVIVLVLAAIITPPDIASQVIVAIPISILYEIGIYIAKIVIKNKENVSKN